MFENAQYLFNREARLLAKVFPEISEKVASEVVLNRDADWLERAYALSMLNYIIREGSQTASSILLTLARDFDKRIADAAMVTLADADRDGLHKDLYWERCRGGSIAAYQVLSLWPDPATISEMKRLMDVDVNPYAEDVLRRLETLSSPDWEDRIASLLEDSHTPGILDPEWAIAVTRSRRPAKVMETLRERLNSGFAEAQRSWERASRGSRNVSFEMQYATVPELARLTDDPDYDQMLVAYFEMGGKLMDVELKRLRTFGYGCDPRERLLELMAQHGLHQ